MNKEIEARFLEVDKGALTQKLRSLGAVDKGEVMLREIIFYDAKNKWQDEGRFVRVRSSENSTTVTYKQNQAQTIDSATEIEFSTEEPEQVEKFFEHIGLIAFRHQEKRRHTFIKDGVTIDIDTWPKIPAYVEFEGSSEAAIRSVAEMAGFNWNDAVFDDARKIIENRYHMPVGSYKWFTFDRCG